MKVRTTIGVTLALTLMSQVAHAQPRGVAGTWVMDPARSESAAQGQPVEHVTLVVTVSPSQVTVERRDGVASREVRYNADGSETTTSFGDDSATGHLRWDGARLITETVYSMHGFPLAQTQILSSDGSKLTVQSTVRVEHGYEGTSKDRMTASPNYSSGTDVFTRRSP